MRSRFNEAVPALPHPESRVPCPTIHQRDAWGVPLRRLLGAQIAVRVTGERDDAEPVPLPGQHLQRRSADRPGRAKDCNPNAHITPNMRYRPAAAGITKYRESSRSSTPPCPGMSVEESLRPTSRLNSDSAISPICPTMETARPNSNSWPGVKLQPFRFSTKFPSASAAMTPANVPPTAPACVFWGERTGASLGPPTAVPVAIAAVSHTHVMTRGNSVSMM